MNNIVCKLNHLEAKEVKRSVCTASGSLNPWGRAFSFLVMAMQYYALQVARRNRAIY